MQIEFKEGGLEEAQKIASQMGLTVDEVLDILLRKFNAEGGFFFSKTEILLS